ncbi:2-nitropropane dioxygenase [Agrocybe pediades]|nr:2-nitropropane dioxygenase [Agrocybe pediades]
MAGASGGALAAQVTLGGGFGFLSAGYDSVDKLKHEINVARDLLRKDGDLSTVLPIGVGFLVWQLEKSPEAGEQLLLTALENHVQAIWLSFGADLGRWINFIREHDPRADSSDAVKIFVQTSIVEEAVSAIQSWKVDVIVAQGNEAGGHGLGKSLPIINLLPLLDSVVSKLNGPPLLAAGGISSGAQIASLLTLGASAVVLGTRFLLSPESQYSNVQRQALLEAESSQSVRTMAFDYARNTLGWPQGIDGRGLRNATVDDYERGEEIRTIQEKYVNGVKAGDKDRIVIWAGSGVGQMKEIMSAKKIVETLHAECVQSLRNASQLVL